MQRKVQYVTVFDEITGRIIHSRSLAAYEDPHDLVEDGQDFLLDEIGSDENLYLVVRNFDGQWTSRLKTEEELAESMSVPMVYDKATLNAHATYLITHPDAYPIGKQLTIDRVGPAEKREKMHAYIDAVLAVANSSEGLPVSQVKWPDLREYKDGLRNAPQMNTYTL